MQHIHFGSCGCAEEAQGGLDLYSLNESIAPENISCMNEATPDSIVAVISRYEDRALHQSVVESDVDGELLIHVKFNPPVRLKSFIVSSAKKPSAPKNMSVFVDPSSALDFTNLSAVRPTSKIILEWDPTAEKHCVVTGNAYHSVESIYLHINTPTDSNEDEIQVGYIGFFGNHLKPKVGVVRATYEKVPDLSDHQVDYTAHQTLGFGL